MKRVVTHGDLTQRAMRPAELFDEYLARAEADVVRFDLRQDGRPRACPACGGPGEPAFVRLGFPYERCVGCGTLFVSPMPDPDRLARYLTEGSAEAFRRERLLPLTSDVRARHTLAPRAHWVIGALSRLGQGLRVAHPGGMQGPLDELLRAAPRVIASVEDVPLETPGAGVADAVLAFELLERAPDLAQALAECRRMLRTGGLLFVTTMSGEGFEIRMLGARTRSLVPPVHLQLLSRRGWEAALGRESFAMIEYSTPGELDVQAALEACRREPDLRLPPILDELIRHEDEEVTHAFQQLLQQAGLSAHVQLVASAGLA